MGSGAPSRRALRMYQRFDAKLISPNGVSGEFYMRAKPYVTSHAVGAAGLLVPAEAVGFPRR